MLGELTLEVRAMGVDKKGGEAAERIGRRRCTFAVQYLEDDRRLRRVETAISRLRMD